MPLTDEEIARRREAKARRRGLLLVFTGNGKGKSTAARLDDVLNWAPSRMSALALASAALLLRDPPSAGAAWRTWQREGGRTASPNAGRPMAAMAGALVRRLEKPGHYVLGEGLPVPGPADVRAAVRLAGTAAALLAGAALLWEARRCRSGR